jgi:hypothetical protein
MLLISSNNKHQLLNLSKDFSADVFFMRYNTLSFNQILY